MSSVEPPSAPRPLWVAGVVALGVAAVALAVGLFSLFGGDQGTDQLGQQTTTTTEPVPVTTPPPAVTTTETPPVTTAPPTTTPPPAGGGTTQNPPVTTTPGTGGGNGGNGGNRGTVKPRAGVRVYNNSTIPKLADRAAQDMREAGWTVDAVDNYPHGTIYTTTVYFTPGSDEEVTARTLGTEFGMRVEPRFDGIKDAKAGVIVILTKDYKNAASAK